jgi:hypothetical protein
VKERISMQELMEYRVRSKVSQTEMEAKVGRILQDDDFNIVLTGPTRMMLPSGEPLCVYLPGAISEEVCSTAYPILHPIQAKTDARSHASGSLPVKDIKQVRYRNVASSIMGNIEPMGGGRFPFCRTTAWTGRNTAEFRQLYPLFEVVAEYFKKYVHHRYKKQMERTLKMEPDWRISSTPFTTMTVNNNYPTGVHTDKGDLEDGYSCLMVLRKGDYSGGNLVFPEYRVAVNMQEGDLLLMDAHQWHGNTNITLHSEDAERISLVLYYRTDMMFCGTMEAEAEKENYMRAKPLDREKYDRPEEELEYEFTVKGKV